MADFTYARFVIARVIIQARLSAAVREYEPALLPHLRI